VTEIKFEALAVLLVLLPGFISARIVDSLCTKSKQSELDTVVEALIYSFFVYVLLIATTGRLPFSVSVETKGATSEYLFIPALRPLAMSAVLAGLLGLLSALNVNYGMTRKALEKLKITRGLAKESVWIDTFKNIGGYVQVQLKDGRSIIGWVRRYSETSTDPSLFVDNAAWFVEGETVNIPGPGILIRKEAGIQTISFLKSEKEAAKAASNRDIQPAE
jgi:Family of unknown function (DUF6338)